MAVYQYMTPDGDPWKPKTPSTWNPLNNVTPLINAARRTGLIPTPGATYSANEDDPVAKKFVEKLKKEIKEKEKKKTKTKVDPKVNTGPHQRQSTVVFATPIEKEMPKVESPLIKKPKEPLTKKAARLTREVFEDNPLRPVLEEAIADYGQGQMDYADQYGELLQHLAKLKELSRTADRNVPYDLSTLQHTLDRYTMAGSLGPAAYRPTRTLQDVDEEQRNITTTMLDALNKQHQIRRGGLSALLSGARTAPEFDMLHELMRNESSERNAKVKAEADLLKALIKSRTKAQKTKPTKMGKLPAKVIDRGSDLAEILSSFKDIYPAWQMLNKKYPRLTGKGWLNYPDLRKLGKWYYGDRKGDPVMDTWFSAIESTTKPLLALKEKGRISDKDYLIAKRYSLDHSKPIEYNMSRMEALNRVYINIFKKNKKAILASGADNAQVIANYWDSLLEDALHQHAETLDNIEELRRQGYDIPLLKGGGHKDIDSILKSGIPSLDKIPRKMPKGVPRRVPAGNDFDAGFE